VLLNTSTYKYLNSGTSIREDDLSDNKIEKNIKKALQSDLIAKMK
jgi:hypothetical protein